jgi:hypothetical protein
VSSAISACAFGPGIGVTTRTPRRAVGSRGAELAEEVTEAGVLSFMVPWPGDGHSHVKDSVSRSRNRTSPVRHVVPPSPVQRGDYEGRATEMFDSAMSAILLRRRAARRSADDDLPFPGSHVPSAWVALAEAFLDHRDNDVAEAAVYARRFIKAQTTVSSLRTQRTGEWVLVGRQRLRARRATQAERAATEPGDMPPAPRLDRD